MPSLARPLTVAFAALALSVAASAQDNAPSPETQPQNEPPQSGWGVIIQPTDPKNFLRQFDKVIKPLQPRNEPYIKKAPRPKINGSEPVLI